MQKLHISRKEFAEKTRNPAERTIDEALQRVYNEYGSDFAAFFAAIQHRNEFPERHGAEQSKNLTERSPRP